MKPHLMLTGHNHRKCISPIGGKSDGKGQPCPVIVATEVEFGENLRDEGCAVTLDENAPK